MSNDMIHLFMQDTPSKFLDEKIGDRVRDTGMERIPPGVDKATIDDGATLHRKDIN
jgi:hypothetical protein